jgi:hypothetical protein
MEVIETMREILSHRNFWIRGVPDDKKLSQSEYSALSGNDLFLWRELQSIGDLPENMWSCEIRVPALLWFALCYYYRDEATSALAEEQYMRLRPTWVTPNISISWDYHITVVQMYSIRYRISKEILNGCNPNQL